MNGNNFSNANFPGGCGVNTIPTYGTYQMSLQCPNDGLGTASFPTQTAPLQFALTQSTPKATVLASSVTQFIVFGAPLGAGDPCTAFVSSVTGIPADSFTQFGALSAMNTAWLRTVCFAGGRDMVISLIAKVITGDLASLSGNQVVVDPCSSCDTSDVEFQAVGGCNNTCDFGASNILIGDTGFFVLRVPAGVSLSLNICSCIVERPAFNSCPTGVPQVAVVPQGALCPTPNAQPVLGQRIY